MMILVEGTASLIARQASIPERFGIRMSRSTTSGVVLVARFVPSTPSPASPTTSMPGSTASSIVRPRRNSSWSSTTSTLIGSRSPSIVASATRRSWHVRALRGVHAGGGEHEGVALSGHPSRLEPVLQVGLQIQRDHSVVVAAPPVDDRRALALLVHEQVE